MSGTSYLVVNAVFNPEEKEALAHYTSVVSSLLAAAGGKPVGRYQVTDHIVGKATPQMTLVMEFSDGNRLKDVFGSDAYQALVPYRDKAFASIDIFIGKGYSKVPGNSG